MEREDLISAMPKARAQTGQQVGKSEYLLCTHYAPSARLVNPKRHGASPWGVYTWVGSGGGSGEGVGGGREVGNKEVITYVMN